MRNKDKDEPEDRQEVSLNPETCTLWYHQNPQEKAQPVSSFFCASDESIGASYTVTKVDVLGTGKDVVGKYEEPLI